MVLVLLMSQFGNGTALNDVRHCRLHGHRLWCQRNGVALWQYKVLRNCVTYSAECSSRIERGLRLISTRYPFPGTARWIYSIGAARQLRQCSGCLNLADGIRLAYSFDRCHASIQRRWPWNCGEERWRTTAGRDNLVE